MLICHAGVQLEPPDDPMRILKHPRRLSGGIAWSELEPPDDPMRILKLDDIDASHAGEWLEPPDDPMRILKL